MTNNYPTFDIWTTYYNLYY